MRRAPTFLQPTNFGSFSYPCDSMRIVLAAICICLKMQRARAEWSNQTRLGVIISPHTDGVEIDIQFGDVPSQSDFNMTYSVPATAKPTNENAGTALFVAHTLCSSGTNWQTNSTLMSLPASTTQGFFPNSTQSPAGTGRFQTPSRIDLTAFSGSPVREHPVYLSVVVVAMVAMVGPQLIG